MIILFFKESIDGFYIIYHALVIVVITVHVYPKSRWVPSFIVKAFYMASFLKSSLYYENLVLNL